MSKFKCWNRKDRWIFLLTMGVILCILAFPVGRLTERGAAAGGQEQSAGSGSQRVSGGAGEKNLAGSLSGGVGNGAGGSSGAAGNGSMPAASPSAVSSDSYEAELEQRVKAILRNVDGVGEVDVMIVLKSSAEKVMQTDGSASRSTTEEQDSSGGTRKLESTEQERSAVMTSGEGGSAPVIAKELRPEISGIVISAAGGGSPTVQAEISAAMEALFGLPAHKIKVLKRAG